MAVLRRRNGRLALSGRSVAEDGGSRASCLARKAWHTPGKKVGGAVASYRPGRRQTRQSERPPGRFPRTVPRDTTRIGASRGERAAPPMRSAPIIVMATRPAQSRRRAGRACRRACPAQGGTAFPTTGRLCLAPSATWSRHGAADMSASSEAISASGALNRPRRSSGDWRPSGQVPSLPSTMLGGGIW
jgi:hypothetical protein